MAPGAPSPRVRPSHVALIALLALVVAGCSSSDTTPGVSVTIGQSGQSGQGGGQMVLSLQLLIALTVLAMAPSILLMATSFTRIVVVLSLLRSAIGIPQLPPNQVIVSLALFLSLFVMAPVLARVNSAGGPALPRRDDHPGAGLRRRGEADPDVHALADQRGRADDVPRPREAPAAGQR